MKILYFFFLVPILFLNTAVDISGQDSSSTIQGKWKVDLRPTPESEAYWQAFSISKVSGNQFSGTFYGSYFSNGQLNDKWGKTYFAFITKDRSNTYFHSGYLEDGQLYGVTFCPERKFTQPWTGYKN